MTRRPYEPKKLRLHTAEPRVSIMSSDKHKLGEIEFIKGKPFFTPNMYLTYNVSTLEAIIRQMKKWKIS